jgi:hypothetical protein
MWGETPESAISWVRLLYAQKLAMSSEIMDERLLQVAPLTAKLIKQLGPYVKAHAGEEDVHAMSEFVNMITREAKDLKKESFGAEVRSLFSS